MAVETLCWRDFLNTVSRMTAEELTEDALHGLVKRLTIDSALLAPYIQFNQGGYARNVLFRDGKFEAICLCWEPGQYTAVHNHGGSFGVVYVHEGVIDVTTYGRVDDGREPGKADLANTGEYSIPAGGLLLDRRPSIHRLGNAETSPRRAVSLHFYAGPLDVMQIFDPETHQVWEKPMKGEPMIYVEPEAHIMAAMI